MEAERLTEFAKGSAVIRKKDYESLQLVYMPVIVDSRRQIVK